MSESGEIVDGESRVMGPNEKSNHPEVEVDLGNISDPGDIIPARNEEISPKSWLGKFIRKTTKLSSESDRLKDLSAKKLRKEGSELSDDFANRIDAIGSEKEDLEIEKELQQIKDERAKKGI